ncbi:hypothetical protein [Alkalihalobacterium chitinilyticum]|uniref:Band 7 domain-containing protein n=1 Tax=Alkalihalobacterium chitinilyticum TaxID=2980103 RepID=A0ABT5VKQ6_9BACI|nr:hypothetical protein [Alkalihalobacterium chitinilyticum]MDE5416035.1 hypothetical protein [Alkalihalobacterium chitinilyticum]
MTILIPTWLGPILWIIWNSIFILLYLYIVWKVFQWLKIKANHWVIGGITLLALIWTSNVLEGQYRVFYPAEHDLVIKGDGSIVENAANKRLITTDKGLFVFIRASIPFEDTMSYSFETKDGQKTDFEIILSYSETDVISIIQSFQAYKELVDLEDISSMKYFSSTGYYIDVVEETFTELVSQQIQQYKAEELTNEIRMEIVKTFESEVLNDHEKNLFSMELK